MKNLSEPPHAAEKPESKMKIKDYEHLTLIL